METATRMPAYSTYCNTEFIAFLLLLHKYPGEIAQDRDGEDTDRTNDNLHSEASFSWIHSTTEAINVPFVLAPPH